MAECINPKEIQAGDLIAYVDGEANMAIQSHITRCLYCTAKVLELCRTSKLLFAGMYRAHCPSPEMLGQYHLDTLMSNQRLTIAAHVRSCPHCTQELEILAGLEQTLMQRVLRVFQNVTQVIEAVPVLPLHSRSTAVRGGTQQQQAFRGAGIDVLVGFEFATQGHYRGTLTGSIVQIDAISDDQVWLFQEGQPHHSASVDVLGVFVFEDISPGEYALALKVGEQALLLREVKIDAA